jgi:predicted kinase
MIAPLTSKNTVACYVSDMLGRPCCRVVQEPIVSSTPARRVRGKTSEVTHQLRQDIHAGRFKDGEVLPTTKALAIEFGVSDFTVSTAIKPLEKEGLIEAKSRIMRVVRLPGPRPMAFPRPDRPQAVLIGGYAGSGKSELGRVLARHSGWALLDKDTMTRPLVEMALETLDRSPHDRESSTYLTVVRPREYEALEVTVLENIECGASVITSAPYLREFTDPGWLRRTESAVTSRGADLTLVWVRADLESMQTYIRRRGAARDATKLEDWQRYVAGVNLDFRPGMNHELIDNSISTTTGTLTDQAQQLLANILERAAALCSTTCSLIAGS